MTKPKDNLVNWLLLDLNSFFASCEQQMNPRLRNRVVGVVPMMGVDTTCLLAVSYSGKRLGLRTGTPVGEAKSICPDIVLIAGDHKKYRFYHDKVIEAIESCTHVDRILSIDEMACRMTGSQRIPENAIALAKRIKEKIRAEVGECLTSSIGIAPNILLAKAASDMQKPDGLVVITPDDIPNKLLHVKLNHFSGIGPQMKKRLNRHGVFTVSDLYECDHRRMRAIWGGVEGTRFHAKLWGQDIERETGDKKVLGHQHVLEPRLRNRQDALNVLQHLLMKAAERLRRYDYYCKRFSIVIRLDHHMGYWWRETDFAETQDTQFLLRLLEKFYQEYDGTRPLRVGVTLHGLVPAHAHQEDLFAPRRPAALLTSIDEINKKYGRHSVTFGLNTYVQEKVGGDKIAFQRVPEVVYL
jgi:DNA polymerase-4